MSRTAYTQMLDSASDRSAPTTPLAPTRPPSPHTARSSSDPRPSLSQPAGSQTSRGPGSRVVQANNYVRSRAFSGSLYSPSRGPGVLGVQDNEPVDMRWNLSPRHNGSHGGPQATPQPPKAANRTPQVPAHDMCRLDVSALDMCM